MIMKFSVRTHELATGNETVEDAGYTERGAVAYAERLAEEFYGGDDVTWFSKSGPGHSYKVGRIDEDGNHEPTTCVITVEEEEREDDEPVEAEAIDDVTPTNKPE